MGLMSDAAEWCWLLVAHGCQAMPIFRWQLAERFGTHTQNWTKSHGICGHETISAASRPLNILHMGLMSDAAEWCWCWLMVALVCQAMSTFVQLLAPQSLAITSKSGPKVMAFVMS